jgi:hypothetical protein
MTEHKHHELKALDLVVGEVERKAAVEAERKRKFTQTDVTHAVKGVQVTGALVSKVEVTREKITVETGKAEAGPQQQEAELTPLEA